MIPSYKKLQGYFVHNWRIKLISLLIALILWYFARS